MFQPQWPHTMVTTSRKELGIWGNPQQGPVAQTLVRMSGAKPLKLKAFCLSCRSANEAQICPVNCSEFK